MFPSKARISDEKSESEEFVSGLQVIRSVGKET